MQGVDEETCSQFLKLAHESVRKGIENSSKEFSRDPAQYDFRTAKAVWMNAQIKKLFQQSLLMSTLRNKVKHLKSHGVDYYLLQGKMLVCFKKMDKKSRVSGFYSKRFKNSLMGGSVNYSKRMLDNLSKMGIIKPLPIYYVGHIIDTSGKLIDVRLVNYENLKVSTLLSLVELFKPNLFSNSSENESDLVKSKAKEDLVRLKPGIIAEKRKA